MYRLAALLLSALLLSACNGGGSSNANRHSGSATAPGSILDAQPCEVGSPLPPHSCWRLVYRTTDTEGLPIDTLNTVLVPDSAPGSGRVLLTYMTAQDSLSTEQAPSNELDRGSSGDAPQISAALMQGWVVAVPDYEGPDSQFAAGIIEGQAVLDGVRSALALPEAGLQPDSKVALQGYSGGGLAAGWAMELQAAYAPELNIVGVAHGGHPASLYTTARNLDGGPFSAFELLAAIGLKRAYSFRFDFESVLNEAGQAMEDDIGDMGPNEALPAYAFRRLDEFTTIPDLLDHPPVKAILDELEMGQLQNGPMVPSMYLFHGILDEINPIAVMDRLRDSYCAQGVPVIYERGLTGEHVISGAYFHTQAVPYLRSVFTDMTPINPLATTCN